MFDYIVVGSGFAGSTIAERIANVLNKKVLIIEKRTHIGGNCFDIKDENDIIIHKYGPHLLHTDHEKIFHYLSNFTEWDIYHHEVLAFIDGKKVPIPFNFNTLDKLFPLALSQKLQNKLLEKFKLNEKVPILELKKINDKDIQLLAQYIYEKVFLNYTIKQWGYKPEEIDPNVTARVPVFIGRDNRYFNDKYQAVPKLGYTKIFERMLNNPNIKLLLNTDFREVLKVDLNSKKIYFLGQNFKGKLIFTGMIDELFNYRFGKLSYRSLNLEFKKIDKTYFQEVAIVNYPNDYDFTRITEFKHIHKVETKKTTILYEYPKTCQENDIPYYPLFTKESIEEFNKYKELSEKFENLVLVGRLADYKYYNMDDIVKRALEVFEEKIK